MIINRKALAAAFAFAGAVSLHAQGIEKNVAFQYFTTSDEGNGMAMRVEALGGKVVTGRPFSATEVRSTRQTLGDGTHIDKTGKDKYFRDSDGRTRIERENGGTVIITDPTTGATSETSNGKSKLMMMRSGYSLAGSAVGVSGAASGPRAITITAAGPELHREMLDKIKVEGAPAAGVRVLSSTDVLTRAVPATTIPDKGVQEDLGDQTINGVMAHGTRTTITIPVGQIGNDREIKVVSERWFSNDLGVLIRSSNNDPRFGTTTFELVDILQGAQDPTLFQMPSNVNHR